jgi:hypothetical protein
MADNLPASAYAKPHTMTGKSVTVSENPGSGKNKSDLNNMRMSVGNISNSTPDPVNTSGNTSGIQVRGGKAQTKGKMARGPMA